MFQASLQSAYHTSLYGGMFIVKALQTYFTMKLLEFSLQHNAYIISADTLAGDLCQNHEAHRLSGHQNLSPYEVLCECTVVDGMYAQVDTMKFIAFTENPCFMNSPEQYTYRVDSTA